MLAGIAVTGRATEQEFQGLPDPLGPRDLRDRLDPLDLRASRGLLGRKDRKAKQVRLGRRVNLDLKATPVLQDKTD
jgi:hypothetical protein